VPGATVSVDGPNEKFRIVISWPVAPAAVVPPLDDEEDEDENANVAAAARAATTGMTASSQSRLRPATEVLGLIETVYVAESATGCVARADYALGS